MDCSKEKDRNISRDKFNKVKTFQGFIDLWSKFYTNEICIPTYLDNFVGAGDNPDATIEMGKKFQEIVSYGIIPHNFQTNSLEDTQKAYVDMYVPNELASVIAEYINRYPGYVSFWQDIKDEFTLGDLVVTYDPTEEERKNSVKKGVFFGDPFSRLGYAGQDDFDFISEWLSKKAKKIINKDNFKQVTVIDTIPTAKSDRILDVILYALRDNKNRK